MKIARAITIGGTATLMLTLSACGSEETTTEQTSSEDVETAMEGAGGDVVEATCDGPLDREDLSEQDCTVETHDGEEHDVTVTWHIEEPEDNWDYALIWEGEHEGEGDPEEFIDVPSPE